MGCWTHHNMWLLFIAGLQVGLLTALAPDSTCDPNTEFSCRNDSSICIALSRVKDGSPDCPDRSDEECNEDEFQCQSIHQCIPKERFHDGWPDCDDGSDEKCSRGQFRCRCGVPHCIEGSKVKDGTKDCEDGSDEEKNQNKTIKCPDEGRLQDLLAVEKRRRRRQIHAYGTDLEVEDARTFEEKALFLQPSVAGTFSKRFEYSYTKFLNDRLSREEYNPLKDVKLYEEEIENTESSVLRETETLSTRPFMVRTETDSYGSLNSGKIYQTAVNEPRSVFPTAEYTIMKFDDTASEKKFVIKSKLKKNNEYHPRRFTDLMLKIAALFQNESKISSTPKKEGVKEEGIKHQEIKLNKSRKLLSVNGEQLDFQDKLVFKRSLQNTKSEVSHIPLVHSPTVPYVPQSNVHTTGIVMSTTGTDIIGGRTTEWTTIIEGTFISGTYAHIVHSTSRIYYTVDTSSTKPDSITPTHTTSVSVEKTDELFTTTAVINSEESVVEIEETTVKEINSPSQRINDKSLRALDAFIDVLSISKVTESLLLEPTSSYSTILDIINEEEENEKFSSEYTLKSSLTEPLESEKGLNTLSVNIKDILDLEPSKRTDSSSFETSTSLDTFKTVISSSFPDKSEILSMDQPKNVNLNEFNPFISENGSELLNLVGRMVGMQHSNESETSDVLSFESTVSSNSNNTIIEEIISSPTIPSDFVTSIDIFTHAVPEKLNVSVHDITLFNDTRKNLTIDEFESSSPFEVSILTVSDPPVFKSEEIYSPTETSLSVPDVTDLIAIFLPKDSIDNSKTGIILNTEPNINSLTIKSENIKPTLSSSVSKVATNTDEFSVINSFSSIITEPNDPTTIKELSPLSETEISSEMDSSKINKEDFSTTTDSKFSTEISNSEVMVFLGIASTLDFTNVSPSFLFPSSTETLPNTFSSEDVIVSESESGKSSDSVLISKSVENNEEITTHELNSTAESSVTDTSMSDMTVLLLPSMNLNDLKSLMIPSLSSSMFSIESDNSETVTTPENLDTTVTPALDDSFLTEKVKTVLSETETTDKLMDSSQTLSFDSKETSKERAKRAVSESVTILRPEGRIVSTDAHVYLTPVTHYTTYTYFTTVLIPGGGTQIRSSLHVDSVILEPTDRAVYGHGESVQPCNECRQRNTVVHNDYETQYVGRPLTEDHYHVETVPYDAGRASEITHRTTYTYYTTRFRGGTSFVETRKETKTDITPIPTARYSPFEIGTYYDGDYSDTSLYHTGAPYTVINRPHDITHRTTYTYYTTRYRNGIPIVETRKVTDTNATPIPTYYRPGHEATEVIRTSVPTYYQTIDPNLYKPDRVTHRTTYTYHTTRFRDGVPIVNTRRETETNVTPIPTHTRPVNRQGQTRHRVVLSRPPTYNTAVTESYPFNRHGTDPLVTHRTTYTYFTTRLIGGSTHVDTRYVTETNVTPNPTVPHAVRGTTYPHLNYDDGYYETECPVCRDAQRGVTRQPHTRVRARTSIRANRRTDTVDPEVTPSTATLYSTYTYATTQLTRGGRPVVRTREHTVTEVLSDVVLPTLKFGDRIRSKRTVRLEDVIPKHTDHVVPIRHTFTRTNSYADGRQGRRIPIHEQNQQRPNRLNSQRGHTPYLKKVNLRQKESTINSSRYQPHGSSHQNEYEIKPTSVTYYSTYTYFTTELSDGKPVTRSREHTVTEILTDVIVPTVSALRRPYAQQATRVYGENSHHRVARDLNILFPGNIIHVRRLLGINSEDTAEKSISVLEFSKLTRDDIFKHSKQVMNTLALSVKPSSKYDVESSISLTPPLETIQFKSLQNSQNHDISSQNKNHFEEIASDEDLMPAGDEVRQAIVPTPVTHYTTFTYYTTKLKPGGSRIIETSTKVSSSITYPHTAAVYDRGEYKRIPYTKRKLYPNHVPQNQNECCGNSQGRIRASPVSHITRTRPPVDTIYGLDSHVIRSSSNSNRRQQIQDYQKTCPRCINDYRSFRNPYQNSRLYGGISRVQKDSYLTKVPVRNVVNGGRRDYLTNAPNRNVGNTGRRVPDGVRNEVYYPDSNIKPTHVTYYSTYTYFTTEPVDGSSVVRSREHTVTEVLTDVIVPTVVSINHAKATAYPLNHRRPKRHNLGKALSKIKHHILNPFHFRKLLSFDDVDVHSNETYLTEENKFRDDNFTIIENIRNASEINVSENYRENITVAYMNDKNISTTPGSNFNVMTSNTFESTEILRSEIFNNNASQLFNIAERNFNNSLKESEGNITFPLKTDTMNHTLFDKNDSVPNEDIIEATEFLQNSEIFNNDTTQLFEISNEPVKEKLPHLIEVSTDITNKTNNIEPSKSSNAKFTDRIGDDKTNNTLLINTSSSSENETHDTHFNTTYNKDEKHTTENVTKMLLNREMENKDKLQIKPSSSVKLSEIKSSTSISIPRETVISEDSVANNERTRDAYFIGSSQNAFLYSTPLLEPAESTFIPPITSIPFSIFKTPSIEKLKPTDDRHFFQPIHSLFNSETTELFSMDDLDAEGAEVRHTIVATPTTHFTTYTYFSTVIKPGGGREVLTNTKVTASTYYPNIGNLRHNSQDNLRNERKLLHNRLSKSVQPRTSIYPTKVYDLYPDRAIGRTQSAYPPSRIFRPYYKPSFDTKVRAPVYETSTNYKVNNNNSNRCLSCNRNQLHQNYQYKNDRSNYDRNRGNSYFTSLPVRRMTTQQRRISNPNTIPYINQEVKPTRVTYYSTYTYFTTELQNGSPVVRSREHTVTEILTDVIVPTVASVSHTRQTKYPSVRGKRDVLHSEITANNNHVNIPFRRRLLAIDESDESSDNIRKLEESKEDFVRPVVSSLLDSVIMEEASVENNLVASFSPDKASPTFLQPSASLVEINDDFLSNAQFSKAFAAYLAFIESSGGSAENETLKETENITMKELTDSELVKSSKQIELSEAKLTSNSLKPVSKSMISILTSDTKKNGRMTKYTTTIYGTYINGVFAQRAESTSEVIPITEIDVSTPVTSLMFSPSRLPGLVRSIVSRRMRGPVAVHLTTEIHGTFVGGAYAQTARIFTSSQPLSSTRETSRHRIPSFTTTMSSGARKTGLLSTRVLRSKVDGTKTLLFVSEIYGTHIGGAYAHLGTYTTRTIIQTTSTTLEPEPTSSTSLRTFYMEDLSTGLVTESVSEKTSNGVTTRFHYQVYGTYLDGTYAHVPSITTETIIPETVEETPLILTIGSQIESTTQKSNIEIYTSKNVTLNSVLKPTEAITSKIGLIRASTRAHVINGTTTQHIFEVHGTFLDGNYAHVPSVSVITIAPSKTLYSTENVLTTSEKDSVTSITSASEQEFEVLTIFSSKTIVTEDANRNYEETIFFPSENSKPDRDITEITQKENSLITNDKISSTVTLLSSLTPNLNISKLSDRDEHATNHFPILLPEALRLSFSRDNLNHRNKRNDPFSPYLRSSFTESIKSQRETQHVSLTVTTPLPASIFRELSTDSIKNASKMQSASKVPKKASLSKTKYYVDTNTKSGTPSSKTKIFLKRFKRSPAAVRTFGSSKRFGSSASSTRKFSPSKSFKRDTSSSSSRGYRSPSSRSTVSPTKSSSRTVQTSKSVPNFLSRVQRTKPTLASKSSSSVKPSSSSTAYALHSARPRRFGKILSDQNAKMEEDFEASEAIPQSVTEEKLKISPTRTSRFRRPTKFSKLNTRSTVTPSSSRGSKISFPSSRTNKISPSSSRRSRMHTKNIGSASRKPKSSFRDYDYDMRQTPSQSIETTSTKRRFTLTTTFDYNLKSTAGYLTSVDDTEEGNNLQTEKAAKSKQRNKSRNSSNSQRRGQGSSYKTVFDSDDNEVRPDKPKSLPLPVFGRSRGLKRPPKFDPRTIKATTTVPSSTIVYITPTVNETEDEFSESELDGPITVTDVYTTVKTLPVHLGLRTSFATITTTAYTTSTIQPDDLTYFTLGGITKTLLSAITGLPDANLPSDKQFTVITEVLLTTTEVESTSLVAIKVGFGTRTDTIVVKQKMTTLSTQTNTIIEEKTPSVPLQQQYPYFPNPFMPPLPPQNTDFSLSLSENSFVSTQTVTSTTVLPLFFNGKTVLTTLTSTSVSEETLVKTTTFKVPQQPTMHPFIFPQPVFILPSVTTQLTVQFTAHNGEIFSIVTVITVPLALNGHTRFARSVKESDIEPTISESTIHYESSTTIASDYMLHSNVLHNNEESDLRVALQSSFPNFEKDSLSGKITETLLLSTDFNNNNSKKLINLNSALLETDFQNVITSKTIDIKHNKISRQNRNLNFIEPEIYHFRKLLQVDNDEKGLDDNHSEKENVNPEELKGDSSTQGSTSESLDGSSYLPDTYYLIGPGFDEEGLNRPIPSVRVVPTRRSYVRRLNLSGSQNLPYDENEDNFNYRRNNQNVPANINIPPTADFSPVRPGPYQDENIGLRRNIPGLPNRQFIPQDGPQNNFGTLRNVQYLSPNRPNLPSEVDRDPYSSGRLPPSYSSNRPNRIQDISSNLGSERNSNFSPVRSNRPPQYDGYDAIRNLPNYTPTRQNIPTREEPAINSNYFGEVSRNQINRPQPTITPTPRRVIRLRRPVNSPQGRPQSGREMLNRKPIVNILPDEKESTIRARGPVVLTNTATIRDINSQNEMNNKADISVVGNAEYTEALPLTYYTTFTYMTTFLNGPSTAYSTREAVVSNIATETLNPRLVGIIRSRGGFTSPSGAQTAVPLGSRAQGATTTIVNLASRVQLYNSDVYYGRHMKPQSDTFGEVNDITPTVTNLRTIPITDIASLPKTYYTLFTYFYTLSDGDKSIHSQRSETTTNVDTQTEPFILQDFASTIDSSGLLTLKPNKQIVKLGLRTAGGTTTEVNLELKTVVHIDGFKNAVIDRGSMTPTLAEVMPSETISIYNNYLDPDDAEVQDQQTYPQTVPIQPSFSSANEVYSGSQRASSNREATPEIPSNSRIIRTQSVRGPLRVASTVLQRPGSLRSGVFAPRPGVRVRIRPASSRIVASESPILSSLQPDISSYMHFDSSRSVSVDDTDFDDDDTDETEEDEENEEYTTEETKPTEGNEDRNTPPSRKRLKITIRRSPGVSATKKTSAIIRPSRTRPRFYVVTRTASPAAGSVRQPKRPISVKVSRRLRPSGEPDIDTSTATSVPVVFGFSSPYRNSPDAFSSPSLEDVVTPEPSKTVVLTYFTTTTYTVPYTVDGIATYTTLEETNSRIATETLDPDADLSFVSTTTLDYIDEMSVSSADLVRHPPQTLKPQLVNNQLNVGSRMNLATKISNGVTLIVATDGESEATHVVSQPTPTLRPTVVTDALLITNRDITTVFEPRTFYTTFTFFTTFFSSGTPSISTSEQVITNVYSVPVTQSITRTQPALEPLTVTEISENVVSMTLYTTHSFYATLFNGTGTIVTPIQEVKSSVTTSTETYTITKTIMPTPAAFLTEIQPTKTIKPISTTTTSIYRTLTNYVTLFSGSETIVSPLEEIKTDILTLTLDDRMEQPSLKPIESYTTRTIQATNTHYVTLFTGSESILSSITQIEPSVITELVNQLQDTPVVSSFEPVSIRPTSTLSPSSSSIEPTFQDLVPSIRTQYTTLTYFTTLFTDSSTILSSREEVATSYITLFVPAPAPGATNIDSAQIYTSQTDILTHGMVSKSSEVKKPSVTPTSEILTFYTTYTYYTTLFRGTETIISDSETVVTQYVTIESTPTDSAYRQTSSLPPTFSRPVYSDSFEVRTEPTNISSPTFDKGTSSKSSGSTDEKASSAESSDDDLKIIGVSTKVESELKSPSLITGIPSTDANGETHILFTDFIVPSSIEEPSPSEILSEYVTPYLPDLISSVIISEPTSVSLKETTFFTEESSTPSSARDSASDLATTRLTEANVATHHIALHPTTSYQSGSSQTMGTKPNVIVELSDVLTNTNIVGNIGEAIKDIVSLLAANGNSSEKISSKASTSTSDSSVMPPSGGITVSSAEEPVYIPIGAIGRSTKSSPSQAESSTGVPMLQPSTMLTGFTPIMKDDFDFDNRKIDSGSPDEIASSTLTSIVFGSNTIFIEPTNVISDIPATVVFSDMDGRFHSSFNTKILQGSESNQQGTHQKATPAIKHRETTSLITGLETIFFGFPDARQPPQITTQLIQGSASTSSIVGYETIFFDSPNDFIVPGSNRINITGDTTIFGAFPAVTESSSSSSKTPDTSFTSTSSGETTIFFPVPGDNQQHNPGTRYVTSVESVTLTLTLTTSSVYQTEDTPVTVTSVFTTTIPPRTFVSTIIGDRTILGTQPEPTEAVQVIPTIQPSESTTTVTTTTLIFNSIATTVVRTLVIPTNAIQPTKPSFSTATETIKLGGIVVPTNERPKVTTERTTPRKPIQLFKSGNRPTEPTTPKPVRAGPPLKLFPTKPPTTTTLKPPTRTTTTRKGTFRKPGKTLVPITDGCPRECNLKNKEVCKQNLDKSWSCQCRPGFFRKNGSEECRDVKSYVVLVRVLKMGDNDVTYSPDLSNHLSPEYKNLTTTARKAVDDAYKTSSVGDDFVSTNVLSVAKDSGVSREGVLVNLTVQLSGEKPANEEFLKEELVQSLESSASEITFANASVVSPIIQRVEDVQDFDECYDDSYNDCSRSAICINLPGTYTCECKDGYQDLEPLLPGRICSGEIKDCDYCNNRGVCIMTEDDNKFCRCYRMYLGKQCEINGLVLAIALPIALALLILTMFCLLCGCRKLRQRRAQKPKPNVFKGIVPPMAGTLDRKAMIMDSSSESSGEHRPPPPTHAYDGFGEEVANSTMKRSRRSESFDDHISPDYQMPTVLIPRAKHSHPKQVNAPYPNYRMPHGDMDRW